MAAESDDRPKPRERTVGHLRQLLAAATLVGGAEACRKSPATGIDSGKDAEAVAVDADASVTPAPVLDAGSTAESTPDAAVFAGPTKAHARADAGAIPSHPGHGYRVVDPLPPPTRLKVKPGCDVPYTYDPATGVKKYKPECL